MRRFLLINTAKEPATVAIATADKILADSQVTDRKQLSEKLLERIDELSRGSKTPLESLAAIGIVRGPGPFTALRIGVAVTNALAYAHKLPIVALDADEVPSDSAFAKTVAARVDDRQTESAVLPHYGRDPSITLPKKK
ncbi:tRNA (adenosine(37)-N6)-threonylcarbamoyltransferase complex dimerization subunit type 1 TsaB [Patescibacteria group bacterium]|nr:tRNA (adenosine(37)-N6)-threonylcarbamoyltransferase complex dimerization subunit type 1 TsaB [Patescibacteria group bacterium]